MKRRKMKNIYKKMESGRPVTNKETVCFHRQIKKNIRKLTKGVLTPYVQFTFNLRGMND